MIYQEEQEIQEKQPENASLLPLHRYMKTV